MYFFEQVLDWLGFKCTENEYKFHEDEPNEFTIVFTLNDENTQAIVEWTNPSGEWFTRNFEEEFDDVGLMEKIQDQLCMESDNERLNLKVEHIIDVLNTY